MEANLEESKNAIVRLLELIDYANQMQEAGEESTSTGVRAGKTI